ncbi:MAG: hypothetical protein ACHQAQ_17420 [Hyphomicrobiales bacterium]
MTAATAAATADLDAASRSARHEEKRQDEKRPGLWSRLHQAIAQGRLRRVEREIGFFIEQNGGRLTDGMERRILERVTAIDRGGLW